ncbi:MAG: hypothetical protein V1829_01040, partial [bacterium]
MKNTAKAFIACIFGAFIGGVIALQLHLYLWWIGMFVGGAIAYLAYDFKQVISAIKTAWKEVIEYWPSKEGIIKKLCKITVFVSEFSSLAWVSIIAIALASSCKPPVVYTMLMAVWVYWG